MTRALAVKNDRPTRGTRDAKGHWLAGHHTGRPKGSVNKADLGLRAIKEAIVASWKTVNGPKLLRELARKDPREYLRLIFSTIPRDTLDSGARPIEIVVRNPEQMAFAKTLKHAVEVEGMPHNEAVLAALDAVKPDLDFDRIDAPTELPSSVAITE